MSEVVVLRARERMVCASCVVAPNPIARMRGLLGRRELPRGHGLLLRRASVIHTWFMRFTIDVAFLDARLTVLAIRRRLRPWRAAWCRGAAFALELAEGECDRVGLREGERLVSSPASR